MPQPAHNRAVLAGVATGMLLVSLPLTWFTIENPRLDFGGVQFGEGGSFGAQGMTLPLPTFAGLRLNVTGLNGRITLGTQAPIWLLVVAAAGASVVAMLNELRVASLPPQFLLLVLAAIGVFLLAGLIVPLTADASLGIGYLIAVVGFLLSLGVVIGQLGVPLSTPLQEPGHEGS